MNVTQCIRKYYEFLFKGMVAIVGIFLIVDIILILLPILWIPGLLFLVYLAIRGILKIDLLDHWK